VGTTLKRGALTRSRASKPLKKKGRGTKKFQGEEEKKLIGKRFQHCRWWTQKRKHGLSCSEEGGLPPGEKEGAPAGQKMISDRSPGRNVQGKNLPSIVFVGDGERRGEGVRKLFNGKKRFCCPGDRPRRPGKKRERAIVSVDHRKDIEMLGREVLRRGMQMSR